MRRLALLLGCAAFVQGCGEERNYNFGVPGSSMDSASSATVPAASAPSSEAAAAESAAASPMGAAARREDAPRTTGASDRGAVRASASESSAPAQGSSGSAAAPAAGEAVSSGGASAEEPFKALARDSRFNEFRSMSSRYMQMKRELYPLGVKLADGSASDDERRRYYALESRVEEAWKPVNAYMWDERWSEDDRAAMGWILYGDMQPPRS